MLTPPRLAALLTVVALGLRLLDGVAWPVSFHPTVQYDCALSARALWLAADAGQRTGDRAAWFDAVGFEHVISPPLLPALVAGCYLVAGDEIPGVSKVLAAGFWAAAAWLIYAAVVRQVGDRWAAVVALGWFLFAPFGIQVSRSFQTEPVLACGFAAAVWHLSRPDRAPAWRSTLAAGAVCGACAFVKPGVLFGPLLAGFAAKTWRARTGDGGARVAAGLHVAVFGLLLAGPSVVYVKLMLSHRGGELVHELLGERWFYVSVGNMIGTAVGWPAVAAGVTGAVLAARAGSRLLPGLFVGYVGYVGLFTFHCATHDYYHTPLMVLAGVGLGWAAAAARGAAPGVPACLLVLLGLVCAEPWRYPRALRPAAAPDPERAAAYRVVREVVPPGERVVAVTEAYGLALEAGAWRPVVYWPRRADVPALVRTGVLPAGQTAEDYLAAREAAGCRFVVVTDRAEYEGQPDLRAALEARGRLVAAAPGVQVFELGPPR